MTVSGTTLAGSRSETGIRFGIDRCAWQPLVGARLGGIKELDRTTHMQLHNFF